MIKLKITNYKAIREATFAIKGFSVLRGASNQGKSSIMQAIKAAMLNRFNGTCVRHKEEKAQVAFLFSDIPDSKFYVSRKASGGSPIYSLHKTDQEPFVLSKLNRDEPPPQFSEPFGVTKVPIANSTEYLNFFDQFLPPLTLHLNAKQIIEVFSNSQLLKEYDKVNTVLTDRRPVLKGQTTAIEQVLYDTTQQLINANALSQKLPDIEELRKADGAVGFEASKKEVWELLGFYRSEYLRIKEMESIQIEIASAIKGMDDRESKRISALSRAYQLRLELEKCASLEGIQLEVKEAFKGMTGHEDLKIGNLQRLKVLSERYEKVTARHEVCCSMSEVHNEVLSLLKTNNQYIRLNEQRSTYLTVTKSIKTLEGLTSKEACPVCGSTLTNHGH